MGLDMYLTRRHYVKNWEHQKPEEKHVLTIEGPKKDEIDLSKVSEITEEVAYWRKANQIHKWFVDNVQDGNDNCGDYYVSRKQLQDLVDLCKQVIKASKLVKGKVSNGYTFENGKRKDILVDGKYIEDSSVAQELLPTQEGFFFGGNDYDEYYLQDLKNTIEQIEPHLVSDSGDFYYHSSW